MESQLYRPMDTTIPLEKQNIVKHTNCFQKLKESYN